ncbi:unnamed protein product [Schistosoma mattheei]|uniref:Uncharacterized protein n=1 Tax=Schistosoma mattheei TaxID=31246 RepID=A0A183PF63_9TREM|nr:unnamed protein product [Schistosoma mattheei]
MLSKYLNVSCVYIQTIPSKSTPVFSTHSTTDYNRRNEEIDPLSASAEYELEKHLEDMDMFEIDFRKGVNGLGISIVGSGVDTSSGEQKLSIFIKSFTPGGAAEADGR